VKRVQPCEAAGEELAAQLAGRGRCARQKEARSASEADALPEMGIWSEAEGDVPWALSAGSEVDGHCARPKEGRSEVEAFVPCALSAGSGWAS
jgi:hypothetical protein